MRTWLLVCLMSTVAFAGCSDDPDELPDGVRIVKVVKVYGSATEDRVDRDFELRLEETGRPVQKSSWSPGGFAGGKFLVWAPSVGKEATATFSILEAGMVVASKAVKAADCKGEVRVDVAAGAAGAPTLKVGCEP